MSEAANQNKRANSVFAERQTYRRRRLVDVARLLPLLAALLFAVPLMWPVPGDPVVVDGGASPVPMSDAIVYVFTVWAGLIVVTGILGRRTRDWVQPETGQDPEQG